MVEEPLLLKGCSSTKRFYVGMPWRMEAPHGQSALRQQKILVSIVVSNTFKHSLELIWYSDRPPAGEIDVYPLGFGLDQHGIIRLSHKAVTPYALAGGK